MPMQKKTGEREQRRCIGTPQGGVISPLLANLFLHYAMDKWLELYYPTVNYVHYADDVIIQCRSKTQADQMLQALKQRMGKCGLALHPVKTKLVYYRDYRRQGSHRNVKFDFLGYSFQPRPTMSRKTRKLFLGYDCAISIGSKKRIADKMEELNIERLNVKSIVGVARFLAPYIRGWVKYYGKFRLSALNPVFQLLRKRLVRWAQNRYKRYARNLKKAYDWLRRVRGQFPNLFYQWVLGFS